MTKYDKILYSVLGVLGFMFIDSAIFPVFPPVCAGISLLLAMLICITYAILNNFYKLSGNDSLENSVIYTVVIPDDVLFFKNYKKACEVASELKKIFPCEGDVDIDSIYLDDDILTSSIVEYYKNSYMCDDNAEADTGYDDTTTSDYDYAEESSSEEIHSDYVDYA